METLWNKLDDFDSMIPWRDLLAGLCDDLKPRWKGIRGLDGDVE